MARADLVPASPFHFSPSPLMGEGWGGGGAAGKIAPAAPPTPTLPHKGGGSFR